MRGLTSFIVIFLCAYYVDYVTTTACQKSMTLYANYTKQSLTSPEYPSTYPRPSSCSWTITASQGNIIAFKYEHFDVLSSIFCLIDLFTVLDGETGWAPELMSMCGSYSKSYKVYRTIGSTVIFKFSADAIGDDMPGFNITYWSEYRHPLIYGSPDYNIGHTILLGASILVFVIFFIYILVLVRMQWIRRKKKIEEDEEYDEKLEEAMEEDNDDDVVVNDDDDVCALLKTKEDMNGGLCDVVN